MRSSRPRSSPRTRPPFRFEAPLEWLSRDHRKRERRHVQRTHAEQQPLEQLRDRQSACHPNRDAHHRQVEIVLREELTKSCFNSSPSKNGKPEALPPSALLS